MRRAVVGARSYRQGFVLRGRPQFDVRSKWSSRYLSETRTLAQAPRVTHDALISPGAAKAKFTPSMDFTQPVPKQAMPIFRVMGPDGKPLDSDWEPDVSPDVILAWYKNMVTISIMDRIMFDAQRQGRLSFYLTSEGEEAIGVGAASALMPDDVLYAQYREQSALLQRGFTIQEFMNQLFANKDDLGQGRNMPVQYGSAKLKIQTISAPLATQIPQAAGAAYALKTRFMRGTEPPSIVACFFGDGAASEGDFHAGLNIAATRSCPVVYICRNNGYAISTTSLDQYRGDGIASRGAGYGISTIRVDGNDIFAVRQAVVEARHRALQGDCQPVLVEAMSYRVSHHSTSDDSFAYRSREEVEVWRKRDGGLNRLRKYLENNALWDEEQEKSLRAKVRKNILQELTTAESASKPPLRAMFDDLYERPTPGITSQIKELLRLIERYPTEYDLSQFDGGIESLKESEAL